jgi:hypothetical protein
MNRLGLGNWTCTVITWPVGSTGGIGRHVVRRLALGPSIEIPFGVFPNRHGRVPAMQGADCPFVAFERMKSRPISPW